MGAAVVRGQHRHGEHLRVAQVRQAMAALAQQLHGVVNHDVSRYNQIVVHGSSAGYSCHGITVVSSAGSMNGN